MCEYGVVCVRACVWSMWSLCVCGVWWYECVGCVESVCVCVVCVCVMFMCVRVRAAVS